MAEFRVETVLDKATGRYFAEVYVTGNDKPTVVTDPIYASHEAAERDILEMFRNAKDKG